MLMYSTIVELVMTALVHAFPGAPRVNSIVIEADYAVIYMQHHGQTLKKYLESAVSSDPVMRAPNAYKIIRSLVITLLHLKRAGVLHTDIKPCNVLIDGDVTSLIDYNCAAVAEVSYLDGTGNGYARYVEAMGTFNYAAPELLFSGRPSPTSCVWSLALLACVLFADEFPMPTSLTHDGNNKWRATAKEWKDVFKQQQGSATLVVPSQIMQAMGDDFRLAAWVTRALSWEPAARPTLEEIAASMGGGEGGCEALVIYEPLAMSNLTRENRVRAIDRFYNLACDTRTQAWFATAVYLLDLLVCDICVEEFCVACWILSGLLHNEYVLDNSGVMTRLSYYFKVVPTNVAPRVWQLASAAHWNVWARPLDVILIEDYGWCVKFYELKLLMAAIDRPWTPSSYASTIALKACVCREISIRKSELRIQK